MTAHKTNRWPEFVTATAVIIGVALSIYFSRLTLKAALADCQQRQAELQKQLDTQRVQLERELSVKQHRQEDELDFPQRPYVIFPDYATEVDVEIHADGSVRIKDAHLELKGSTLKLKSVGRGPAFDISVKWIEEKVTLSEGHMPANATDTSHPTNPSKLDVDQIAGFSILPSSFTSKYGEKIRFWQGRVEMAFSDRSGRTTTVRNRVTMMLLAEDGKLFITINDVLPRDD